MIKVGDYVQWNGTCRHQIDEFYIKEHFTIGKKYEVVHCNLRADVVYSYTVIGDNDDQRTLYVEECFPALTKKLEDFM